MFIIIIFMPNLPETDKKSMKIEIIYEQNTTRVYVGVFTTNAAKHKDSDILVVCWYSVRF